MVIGSVLGRVLGAQVGQVGGHVEKIVGTACRQADGSWRPVS